jgi:rSAM/selenodomain-associated transferase 1
LLSWQRLRGPLNVRFLRDTTENLATIPGSAGLVSYTPVGDESLFAGMLPATFALVPQRGDAFGERLLAAAQDILAIGYGSVCLIDSDSPTVPAAAFAQAVEALAKPGDRIVLGPSDDGGYYLIGMKTAHAEPFERITWSTSNVFAQTIERCREAGLEVVTLPTWYDVDDAATLHLLNEELLNNAAPNFAEHAGYAAPHTREFLLAMQLELAPAGTE